MLRFNHAGPADARFAGIHLDIEPHAQPSWKSAETANRCTMLTRLVEVHAKAARLLHERAPNLLYGADVVFWLGKTNADGSPVYPVTFNGVTEDAEKHLLGFVDQLAIMSYRSFAEGPNGIISLVERTVARADQAHGRVFIGVKMANIGPPLESFYGQTEAEMHRASVAVEGNFREHRGYAGIAYFMYSAYRTMPRK